MFRHKLTFDAINLGFSFHDKIAVFIQIERAMWGRAFHGEGASDPYSFAVFVRFVVEDPDRDCDASPLIVHLFGGRKASALIKDQMAVLCQNAFLLSGFWNGGDVRRLATVAENFLRRLSVLVKFPVAGGASVGGIQYGMVEKGVCHTWFSINQ